MGLFNFLGGQLLKVLEWNDDTRNTIVYRFPMNGKKIMCGSTLTVKESQVAIFVNNGKICDIFEPGMHKLNTSSLPILSALMAWPSGFKSPFSAEVYFVSTKQFTNQKWGTTNPITLRDADFGSIRIRGYGSFSFRVEDPERILKELFGTNSTFRTEDIIDYLKSYLVAGITDTIAESKISALDLSANLMEFNQACKAQVGDKFKELGLELVNLICENFSFPEEVEKAIDTRSSMGVMDDKMDTFVKYQAAHAMRESANNTSNNMASAGLNLGAGFAMSQMFTNAFNNQTQPAQNNKICPSCNYTNAQNAKFCANCGYSFAPSVCPGCHTKIQPGTKFCSNCGHKF
ncbi:MAG: SPFH domain-containing protein [Clostridia bacterium]|nr:SPFH domain-containing protein [Clostridia bacterium]